MAAAHRTRRCSPEWVMRGYGAAAVFLWQVHCDAIEDALNLWCEMLHARPRR